MWNQWGKWKQWKGCPKKHHRQNHKCERPHPHWNVKNPHRVKKDHWHTFHCMDAYQTEQGTKHHKVQCRWKWNKLQLVFRHHGQELTWRGCPKLFYTNFGSEPTDTVSLGRALAAESTDPVPKAVLRELDTAASHEDEIGDQKDDASTEAPVVV
jgi:hypothetical protein